MKKLSLCGVFLTFALVLGGCPTGSPSTPASGNLGEDKALDLKGDVYTVEWEGSASNPTKVTYTKAATAFDGTVTSNLGGTGEIKNGKLTFKIDPPAALTNDLTNAVVNAIPVNNGNDLSDYYSNVKVTPVTAKYATLSLSVGSKSLDYEKVGISSSDTSYMYQEEGISYLCLSADVTVTGDKKEPWTSSNLNMTLKKGWNIIYSKFVYKVSNGETTYSFTMKDEQHSLRWVVDD
ncbi:MAG: hypothetical protein LBG57_12910 [Treponema sp.]|nr:hypothetical protein [Treponema sp.]